ncbi:gliding motility-associated C-terminal domain-containing protein [Pustulibacterium marinum]|uniref:Gliding motility-associated C-terminal domain-containing protein n=1 Tax=Pustulibacterium marinum TaxID=1224947 RepID=A0A1I7FLK2_9FLAO|nr:choice-of-anchor L domain-containing protein [Pustulibacterium marinum]SFU37089.1 gliding motility-associated C-terminal domain-containing protein [Pustulibacterium marinum]
MKNKQLRLLALFLVFVQFSFSQQITTSAEYTAEELIENILFQGCIEISNVSSPINGSVNNLNSFGYFQSANSNFPFEEGIILATGDIGDAGNILVTDPLNQGEIDWESDADLETALGVDNTLNATVIEFDFIAATNTINFNYILASEEYLNDYPCNYSDSFAFLIKPSDNSAPYTNITLVPGTSTPVSTQNIRPQIVGFCESLNEEYFEGFNVGDTNYNGRTTMLSAYADISPNTSYHIKLVIADQFDENFDSAVFLQGNAFNASVDLGEDVNTCYNSTLIETDIDNPEAVFEWTLNGNPISETTPEITATSSGVYHVTVSLPYAESWCVIEDEIEITLNTIQDAETVNDYQLCELEDNPGHANFNLNVMTASLETSVPFASPEVSYYLTQEDAENQTSAISGTIQNTVNPQTIYVRIDETATGCLAFNSFDLIANGPPVLIQPEDLFGCDSNDDGFETFELTLAGDQATSNNEIMEVTYYLSQDDAENQIGALNTSYTNISNPQTIYLRVENTETQCYNYTSVTLHVTDSPILENTTFRLDGCDQDDNGFANFDLTSVITEIAENYEDYNYSFYTSQSDADNEINSIENPEDYVNSIQGSQVIYIRITDPATGCYDLATINIYASLLEELADLTPYILCDDISNDGIQGFDLIDIEYQILANIGLAYADVSFYLSEEDRDNGIELDKTELLYNTTNPQTLYLSIYSDECSVVEEITIYVNPYFSVDDVAEIQYICDTDADMFTSIPLAQFNSIVANGNDYGAFHYHLTEEEALNDTNIISTLNNTTNPQTIWVSVYNSELTCYDAASITIEVLPAPDTNPVSNVNVCNYNSENTYMFDLTSKIDELLDDTNGVTVEFYTSESDAEAGINIIENPTSYTTESATIYIKSINDETGCYNLRHFSVIIVNFPELTDDNSNFIICEYDNDGVEQFLFSDFDSAIMQGQNYVEVTYYHTETDALNYENAIDKTVLYENTSNPENFYIRRQSTLDDDCYTVDPISVTINNYPVYDAPEDLQLCDDISNDGFEEFDFNDAITNMNLDTTLYDISFYVSENDLYNNTNALPFNYTNTVNPQTVYAKIGDLNACYEVVTFDLNVVQVGEILQPDDIYVCDDDNNGYEIVNIASEDVEVLAIRQYDVTLSYFEDLDENGNGINEIEDPVTYQVSANAYGEAQTVYIIATNTISGCEVSVSLDIYVGTAPQFSNSELGLCLENTSILDLSNLEDQILENSENVELAYYNSLSDAENNTNALGDATEITDPLNNILYVKATNTLTGCTNIEELVVNIYQSPVLNTPEDLRDCSHLGEGNFDLTSQQEYVMENLNSDDFTITYHLSESEAISGENAIPSASLTNFSAYNTEEIFIRVVNNESDCYSITSFTIYIDAYPIIPLEDQYALCLNNMPLVLDADTGNSTDSYLWSTNATTPSINVTATGAYWVKVTSQYGCESTKYVEVIQSESPEITNIDVVSFSENNSITISVTGTGSYLYILDDGEPQTSNVFENVHIGYHTVEVIDENGCAPASDDEVIVLGFPKYFTPNGDGVNDYWNVFGFETLQTSYVAIFDRHGKLLVVLHPNDGGWDGTYNGAMMPSNDYWFKAMINDTEEPFEHRGHFTLKR